MKQYTYEFMAGLLFAASMSSVIGYLNGLDVGIRAFCIVMSLVIALCCIFSVMTYANDLLDERAKKNKMK